MIEYHAVMQSKAELLQEDEKVGANRLDHGFEESYAFVSRVFEHNTSASGLEMTLAKEINSEKILETNDIRQSLISDTWDNQLLGVIPGRPLLIACSGGNGHIAAICALIRSLGLQNVPLFKPTRYAEKPQSMASTLFSFGAVMMRSQAIKHAVNQLNWVSLPEKKQLEEAIAQLDSGLMRPYVDVLLDIYPAGYESAALWNINQRADNTKQLGLLIALQSENDANHYDIVYTYYSHLLEQAYAAEQAYTYIISTQAIGLPGLCDAVIAYNRCALHRPKLVIHQYMTDLPTYGAVHFFNVLSSLSKTQQQQIKLYAVGIKQPVIDHFFTEGCYFETIYSINFKENPMVRPAFYAAAYDNSKHFYAALVLVLQDKSEIRLGINESVATIMLGSQSSTDSIRYVEHLLNYGFNKIFIFGQSNPEIKHKIAGLLQRTPQDVARIVLLDNQNDTFIAALMSRSQLIIMRAGGLSVMEQLAMQHHTDQIILIHCAEHTAETMTSGIVWEDANAESLLDYLSMQQITVMKTSPSVVDEQLRNRFAQIDNQAVLDWVRI